MTLGGHEAGSLTGVARRVIEVILGSGFDQVQETGFDQHRATAFGLLHSSRTSSSSSQFESGVRDAGRLLNPRCCPIAAYEESSQEWLDLTGESLHRHEN